MNEKISQCPKCMTSFRVTDEQLQVAAGKVRCGYCMNVFMGGDYLISGGDSEAADENVLRSLLDPEQSTDLHADDIFRDANPLSGDSAAPLDGVRSVAVEKRLQPDVDLLDQQLKFDEDDLQESSDESWALALLAELEEDDRTANVTEDSTKASQGADHTAGSNEAAASKTNNAAANKTDSAAAAPSAELERKEASNSFEIRPEVEALEPAVDDEAAKRSAKQQVAAELKPSAQGVAGEDDASLYEDASSVYAATPAPASKPERKPEPEPEAKPAAPKSASKPALKPKPTPKPAPKPTPKPTTKPTTKPTPASESRPPPPQPPRSKTKTKSAAPQQAAQSKPPPREPEPAVAEQSDQLPTDFLPHTIEFETEHEEQSAEAKPVQWRWAAAAFGMACLLGLQYVYFNWGDLVANSETRPVLASVCKVVGCTLPPFRDLSSIRVDKHVMQAHADVQSARTLDVIIRNRAKFPQPFPVLQLTFSDMNNLPVATRRFFPNEYLDGELLGLSSMPSGSPVRLSLHVMEPGAEATNYELDLLPAL